MRILPFLLFITSFYFSSLALSGTVAKSTNRKVIVDFDGETIPEPNSRIYILDQETHKEVGLVEIQKVKGTRALGKILKGRANPGDTTDIAQSRKHREEEREPADESQVTHTISRPKNRTSYVTYGVGADFIYTSMYLKNSDGDGSVTGNGLGVRAAIEYPMSYNWVLSGSLGLHPLNVTSTTSGYDFTVATNYLGTEAIARYALDKRNEGLWLGGGLGYYFPMSSNLSTKPKSELTFIGSVGFNLRLSRDYLMVKSDFIMFQNSTIGDSSTQTFQVTFGGVYFF